MQPMQGPATIPGLPRRPQIDGLRSIAMMGVLYVHLYNNDNDIEHLRVSLFFVVSGFLITQILLLARQSGQRTILRNFYVRRALRLFPPLLIALSVAAWFDMDGIRSSYVWHVVQATNLYMVRVESWQPWVTNHLWSLNLLEQFYLLWPIVILLLPARRMLLLVVIALMILPIAVRAYIVANGFSHWPVWFVWAFDPIAGGALLALLKDNRKLMRVLASGPALGLALLVLAVPFLWAGGIGEGAVYRVMLIPTLLVILAGAWGGYGGIVGWVLSNRLMRFISTISYGTYVYHPFIWWALGRKLPWLIAPGLPALAVVAPLSLVAGTLSWYLVERPIASLKHRFPTQGLPA